MTCCLLVQKLYHFTLLFPHRQFLVVSMRIKAVWKLFSTLDGLGKNWRQLLAVISKKAFCVYGKLFVSRFFLLLSFERAVQPLTRTELLSGFPPPYVKRSNFSQFGRFRLKLLNFSLPYRKLHGREGGGRYSLWWPMWGGSARKGYLFQASGIRKGRDFTSWSI